LIQEITIRRQELAALKKLLRISHAIAAAKKAGQQREDLVRRRTTGGPLVEKS
jgi:hypothetical protein